MVIDTYSNEWRLLCLARYVAAHQNPREFAAKLAKRHGQAFVDDLRRRLKESLK